MSNILGAARANRVQNEKKMELLASHFLMIVEVVCWNSFRSLRKSFVKLQDLFFEIHGFSFFKDALFAIRCPGILQYVLEHLFFEFFLVAAHVKIGIIASLSRFPSLVNEYSTRGGISANDSLLIKPSP